MLALLLEHLTQPERESMLVAPGFAHSRLRKPLFPHSRLRLARLCLRAGLSACRAASPFGASRQGRRRYKPLPHPSCARDS